MGPVMLVRTVYPGPMLESEPLLKPSIVWDSVRTYSPHGGVPKSTTPGANTQPCPQKREEEKTGLGHKRAPPPPPLTCSTVSDDGGSAVKFWKGPKVADTPLGATTPCTTRACALLSPWVRSTQATCSVERCVVRAREEGTGE